MIEPIATGCRMRPFALPEVDTTMGAVNGAGCSTLRQRVFQESTKDEWPQYAGSSGVTFLKSGRARRAMACPEHARTSRSRDARR
ncbi:hypothetical protein ACFQ07_15700, partial [Actinomadura adrarensis]